ncbi:hypothetical protein D3C76_744700 [compost metagenome]
MQARTCELHLRRHIRHSVLQCLEGADGNTELLADLEVIGCDFDGFFHSTDQLRAQGDDAVG